MKSVLTLLLFSFVVGATGDSLDAAQALQIALQNHYGIRVAQLSEQKAQNNQILKPGALLPTATLGASSDYSVSTSATPAGSVQQTGWTHAARGTLNWTLFDGLKMFYGWRQIDNQADLAREQTRHTIEMTAVSVLATFYALASAQSLLYVANEQLALSRKSYERAQALHDYGKIDNQILLSRQVALNSDSSAVLARQLDLLKALHTLNLALGRKPDFAGFAIADTTLEEPQQSAEWWAQQALEHNVLVSLEQIKTSIAKTNEQISRSSMWPLLSANASWAQSWGLVEQERSLVGASVSWPIFTGMRTITNVRNTAVDYNIAIQSQEQKSREIEALAHEYFLRHVNAYTRAVFEKSAVEVARRSADLAATQLLAGTISDLAFTEAKLGLLNAQIRLESARFQSILAALELKQLSGNLSVKYILQ